MLSIWIIQTRLRSQMIEFWKSHIYEWFKMMIFVIFLNIFIISPVWCWMLGIDKWSAKQSFIPIHNKMNLMLFEQSHCCHIRWTHQELFRWLIREPDMEIKMAFSSNLRLLTRNLSPCESHSINMFDLRLYNFLFWPLNSIRLIPWLIGWLSHFKLLSQFTRMPFICLL